MFTSGKSKTRNYAVLVPIPPDVEWRPVLNVETVATYQYQEMTKRYHKQHHKQWYRIGNTVQRIEP